MKASSIAPKSRIDRASGIGFNRSIQVTSKLQQLWQFLLKIASSSSDIRIWRTANQEGQIIWNVYDPASDQTARFSSEAEVRVWLEGRYYR